MAATSAEMEVFVRVVASGGFSAAAREMKLTPSAISKLIARLEGRLGVRLLDRSTRSVRLTAEGELYYRHALRVVADIEEIERELSTRRDRPQGPLRVNSSVPIARCCVIPLLPDFLDRYPEIDLDLTLSDAVADLMECGADVAIRIGPLQDSSLRARKLVAFQRVVVASPAYLACHGVPRVPADLRRHNCLSFNLKPSLNEWPFAGCEDRSIPTSGNIRADNGETLRQLALSGAGIARLATFMVAEDIAAGRLLALLEEFHPGDTLAAFAVFHDRKHMAARIRCFIDFLVGRLGSAPEPARPQRSPVLA